MSNSSVPHTTGACSTGNGAAESIVAGDGGNRRRIAFDQMDPAAGEDYSNSRLEAFSPTLLQIAVDMVDAWDAHIRSPSNDSLDCLADMIDMFKSVIRRINNPVINRK